MHKTTAFLRTDGTNNLSGQETKLSTLIGHWHRAVREPRKHGGYDNHGKRHNTMPYWKMLALQDVLRVAPDRLTKTQRRKRAKQERQHGVNTVDGIKFA